jgi:large subunit ribosomal protein L24
LHVRHKLLSVHVDKTLREKIKKRAIPVRKGDEVKVMRGKRKGMKAKVVSINTKKKFVFLEGQTRENIRGTKVLIPFSPSNLLLITMKDDKRRNRQGKKVVKTKPVPKTEKKVEKKPEKKEEKVKKKEEKKKEAPKTPTKEVKK